MKSTLSSLPLLSLLLLPLGISAQEAPPADTPKEEVLDSVRFIESADQKSQLQTAVISFHNEGGTVVDLVSVVHIGDERYFDQMNQHLSTYDVVLYEMVGGPMETRDERQVKSEIGMTHLLQRVVQSMLGLKYQLDGIDYSPDNFVHADANWEQWESLMEAKNQSMTTLFTRAMKMQDNEEMKEVLEKMNGEETMGSILSSITEFNPDRFKRSLAPMLSESEAFIQQLEGEDGTVLIAERNKIVMEEVEKQMAAGKRRIGVFYGAGHMPDFKNRLEAIGFEERRSDWMTAWSIGNSQETVSSLDLLENVLKDDAVIEGFITFFRELAGE
ncbi:MAG: hypothetical protein AAF191_19725 [Verrucomicrobiota bacterium]